jgi:hypothetical protein
MIKSIYKCILKVVLLLLAVSCTYCSSMKENHKFRTVIKRDTSYYPYFFPPSPPMSGKNISDYTGITVKCLPCSSSYKYKILSYDVYLRNKSLTTNKYIGSYDGVFFSEELRKKIEKNREKYFSIEFKNIIVSVDSIKLINIGFLSTYISASH